MNLEEHSELLKQEVDQLLAQATFQKSNKELGWTNAVLIKRNQNNVIGAQEKIQFYLPGYLRLKVKNFVSINLPAMQSTLNCSILFSFYYGDLPNQLVDLFKDKIQMNLIRNSSFPLSPSTDCKVIQQKEIKLVNYILRKQVSLSYYPYIDNFPFSILNEYDGSLWFSPYEILSQVLTIQIQKTIIKKSDFDQKVWKNMAKKLAEIGLIKDETININQIRINVNLMDYSIEKYTKSNQIINSQRNDDSVKLQIRKQPLLGKYGIATKKLSVHYTNQSYLQFFEGQRRQKQIQYRKQHCLSRLIFKNPEKANKQNRISSVEQLQVLQKNKYNPQLTNQQTQRKISLFVQKSNQYEKDKQEKVKKMIKKIHFQKQFQNKQISFVNAHFVLPIYRYPLMPLLTIFIPLWLLSIQNLGVYLASTQFSYRLGTLVGIIFANIALIPSYKYQLPPYPGFLLIQLLIYAQQIAILLCLIQSFYKRFDGIDSIHISDAGPLFYISLGLNGVSLIILFVSYILYKCHWEKTYVYSTKEQQQFPVRTKFLNYYLWNNSQCDKHFSTNSQIIPLKQFLLTNNKKSNIKN